MIDFDSNNKLLASTQAVKRHLDVTDINYGRPTFVACFGLHKWIMLCDRLSHEQLSFLLLFYATKNRG